MSKFQDAIGPRGFNGSQGPIGSAGPSGFNGTQGTQGIRGPQGFNGSQGQPGPQGPQGAGDFSQCEHKTESVTGSLYPVRSNSLGAPVKVIQGEASVSFSFFFFFFKKASKVVVHNVSNFLTNRNVGTFVLVL